MDDLSSVLGNALGVKPMPMPVAASQAAMRVSPDDQAARDVERLRILKAERGRYSNPADAAALEREIARATPQGQPQGQPQQDENDLTSVLSAAINAPPLPPKPLLTLPPKPQAPQGQQPSPMMSGLAGAGKSMGTGVLALQQLLGKGTSYAGDAFGADSLKNAGAWLQSDAKQGIQKLEGENAPYAEANPKSNMGGEVFGMVASPINKLVPGFGGPATTLLGAGVKGAAQGAVLNTLTAPVTDESKPFLQEKVRQAFVGGLGGAAGGMVGHTVIGALSKGVDLLKGLTNRVTAGNPAAAADDLVTKTLANAGIDKAAVPPELFAGVKSQVQEAIASGKSIDKAAVTRLAQAQTLPVPVPMLKGQITRDAMQFAKEQNLRGIQGVGEPITQTLTAQNKALIANLDAMGASRGTDAVSAGGPLIETLTAADAKAKQVVQTAYDAFKKSTGKELDVPLQGLAQDYAKTASDFGDAIPSAIRNKFEGLGLMSGKAQKTFSISDAEDLIKVINKNFDPMNKPAATALGELRRSVQNAIADGAGSNAQGAEAAFLAKSAREAASLRFKQIEATPALKDALRGAEPDKFIQKHILQGNKAEIQNLVEILRAENPKAVSDLQDALMTHIKARVLNGKTAENGIFSQDKMAGFVNDPNTSARLTAVLGPDRMAQLKQLSKVAEDALFTPKAAAVNSSNTASAAANLIKGEVEGGAWNGLLGAARNIPGLSTAASFGQRNVQQARAANLIDEAVNPSLGRSGASTPLADLARIGSRAGSAYAERKSAKGSQR